jgi:hypothetical protein
MKAAKIPPSKLERPLSSGIRRAPSGRRAVLLLLGLVSVACTAATDRGTGEPEMPVPSAENLKGCQGKASSSIPSDGVYVLTTFGGSTESQPLACGGHTKSGSWYYAASRQRYGCGARVRITAGGKCVVAQTDDYGPDVCVEKAAGIPVMDASPLVGKVLFGTSGLGWSDGKLVYVEVAAADAPLGPCTSKGDAPAADEPPAGGGGSGGTSGGGSGGTSGGGSGGTSGGSKGTGCNASLCDSGAATTDVSGAECYCDTACAGYGDCCSNYEAVCGGSSGGSGSGGSSSGGQACTSDGACNPGNDGSGLICVSGQCVPGCKTDAQCPGITSCENGQCV